MSSIVDKSLETIDFNEEQNIWICFALTVHLGTVHAVKTDSPESRLCFVVLSSEGAKGCPSTSATLRSCY